jgi:hypothetical protein
MNSEPLLKSLDDGDRTGSTTSSGDRVALAVDLVVWLQSVLVAVTIGHYLSPAALYHCASDNHLTAAEANDLCAPTGNIVPARGLFVFLAVVNTLCFLALAFLRFTERKSSVGLALSCIAIFCAFGILSLVFSAVHTTVGYECNSDTSPSPTPSPDSVPTPAPTLPPVPVTPVPTPWPG